MQCYYREVEQPNPLLHCSPTESTPVTQAITRIIGVMRPNPDRNAFFNNARFPLIPNASPRKALAKQ